MGYKEETLEIAKERANWVVQRFIEEVKRLLESGALNDECHNRGLLFGVALENIADGFLYGERKEKEYKNLKLF